MAPEHAFQIVQIVYWIALSTWFGVVLFLALAPPVILRTLRESNPILPNVLSVNLEGQHATLLAGTIMRNLLEPFFRVEIACAAALLLTMLAQWFLVDLDGFNLLLPILRTAMYLAAVVFLIYDWRVVWPKVWKHRQVYIDNADNPDVANPALDEFDRYQNVSVTLLRNILFLLLGIILFSANIRPPTVTLNGN
jgi:hypothetical protein